MRQRLPSLLFGLFLFAPFSLQADSDTFSYTFLDGFYVHSEVDDGPLDVDGDGYQVNGSLGLGDHFFLFARWRDLDFDSSVDTETFNAGGGLHFPLGSLPLDLVLDAGYIHAEVDTPFGDVDDDGYTVGGSLRASILRILELEGGATYIDLDDFGDGVVFDAMLRLYLLPVLALQAGFEIDDEGEDETYLAGIRFEF